MLGTAFITVFAVKEPVRAQEEASGQQGIIETYAAAFRNKPFMLALTSFALHIGGTAIIQGALIYYFKYIYGGSASFVFAMICLLVPVLVFIPAWTFMSKTIGKKWSYNIGMALVTVAVFVIFLFARQMGPTFFYGVMAIAGVGFSTHYVMPWSIGPDGVELDYAETGVRREGATMMRVKPPLGFPPSLFSSHSL